LNPTTILNSQSESKQPDGIGKSRSIDSPGNNGGVGFETMPKAKKFTSVTEGSAGAVPWFFTVTIKFP
jgi:hypothetical protein